MIGPDLGSVRWPSRQGSLWRERPPAEGEGKGVVLPVTLYPPPCRTSGKKQGVAPSTSSPSRVAPRRAVRGSGHAMPAPRWLYPRGLGESVPTRVQCGFPGTTWTTTARATPSESGVLGLLKGRATTCATYVRHPPFVRWSPIRRHVLDPRRRKSSIMSRPFEAGFSCSHWTIFSMTRSRLAWRSTVSS